MSGSVRVGVIGASPTRGWAVGTHLPALRAVEGLELAAVATTRDETAREAAERFGAARWYGDAQLLIADPDIDLVTVSVKVPNHYEYVKGAIEHGKHVYCEWPLGRGLSQALELASLAETVGVVHAIGLQGRMSPTVNYVRDLVASGYVGQVRYAHLSIELPAPSSDQVTADRVWAADRENGVTTLTIMAGHNLDVLRYVLGEFSEFQSTVAARQPDGTVAETGEPLRVTSPDVVLINGRLSSGAFAAVEVQGGLPLGGGATLEIHGSDGVLSMTAPVSFNLTDVPMHIAGAHSGATPAPLDLPASYRDVAEEIPEDLARNVARLYRGVARAIEGSSPAPEPNFATAIDLHSLVEAVQVASDTGTRQVLGG